MKKKTRRAIEGMKGREVAYIYYQDKAGPQHISGLVEKVTDKGIKLEGCYTVAWFDIETFVSDNKRFIKQDLR